jgi:hypothetical protein
MGHTFSNNLFHIIFSTKGRIGLIQSGFKNDLYKLKSNSSKWISENFELSYGFQWQGGFSSFSVSESQISIVSKYIDRQEDHHEKFSFEKELEDFLRKNKIAFEEKHFLD